MTGTKRTPKALPTIWRTPEDLRELIQPILDQLDPPADTGRKRIPTQPALEGIIYY